MLSRKLCVTFVVVVPAMVSTLACSSGHGSGKGGGSDSTMSPVARETRHVQADNAKEASSK